MLRGGRDYSDHTPSTATSTRGGGMGGGSGMASGPMRRYHSNNYGGAGVGGGGGVPSSLSMNGPVDRVYHFEGENHEASRISASWNGRKSTLDRHGNRSRLGTGGSLEKNASGGGGSKSQSRSYETIDGGGSSQGSQHKRIQRTLPPPPGLRNVGNSCYANAALQCLLSTALPHALLDERNAHIIRRHSFNRKLLVHGSGSVDSADEDDIGSMDSDADSTGGGTFGSCMSGMSCADAEEDDDIILARAMGGDRKDSSQDLLGGLRASPSRAGRSRKRLHRKKQQKDVADDDNNTVTSGSTLYSDIYHVMKSREKKPDEKDSEEDLLCAWLTQELTQITREYTTPIQPNQGLRGEKRSSKSKKNGRRSPPTTFLNAILGGGGQGNNDTVERNRVVDPGAITRHVHKISPCLRPYQQEDSHEFFRALLSSLTMHGQNARLSSLFDGLLESAVTCKTCRKTSLTRDRYMDLSLDIADRGLNTLEKALEKFTEEEVLDGDNMVTCSRCNTKRAVTKGLRLATAPTMLVINYKRFAYDNYGRLSRLSKPVTFPLNLELGDYMSRANRGKPPPYMLVAVLVHRGRSCDCGHYFAYVRKGRDDWYLANDAEVTKVDVEEVLRAQAYVLVYEVEGMKEKYNFDCYSRYHRSLDEADEESMARGNERDDGDAPAWDFAKLTSSLFDACDAGLCGNVANVLDTHDDARDSAEGVDGYRVATQHSLLEEDVTPPRRGGKDRQSPRPTARKSVDDMDVTSRTSHKKERDQHLVTNNDFVKAYYKRGRSHTPSRHSRNRDRGPDRNRSRERGSASSLHDSEPPLEGTREYRRAKSLSRVENKVKAKTRVVDKSLECQKNGKGRTDPPPRRRVPSRPRGNGSPPGGGGPNLPPLHEQRLTSQRSGSSTRGVML